MRCYHINGLRHREDGPSLIYPNGDIFYFINNKNITKK